MFSPGSFVNLSWNESSLNQHHKFKWNDLHINYGLSATPPSSSDKEELSIRDLAASCVSQCKELLFSLTPCGDASHAMAPPDSSLALPHQLPKDMQKLLYSALCDHLIVSFAFRFFCENLSPGTLYLYSSTLYDCLGIHQKNWPQDSDKDQVKAHQNDFYKVVKRRYYNFCEKIGLQSPTGDDSSQHISGSEGTKISSLSYFVSELGKKDIPPPYAWFLLFFLAEITRFQNILGDNKSDRFYSLSDWIGNSEYSSVLLDCITNKNIERFSTLPASPVIFDDWDCSFTCIPSASVSPTCSAIPDMTYDFKGTNESVVIASRLQKVFNNYLFEQNVHLYSLTTAEAYLKQFHCSGRGQHAPLEAILSPLKLHAPFVHSSFISCISGPFGIRETPLLIEQYIARWNEIALPVLEELFIWSVWTHMPSRSKVADAINKWISHDATYNRLSIIRIGQADNVVPISYNNSPTMEEDMKVLHNRLIDLIWE